MPTIPIRFRRGVGLGERPNRQTQSELREHDEIAGEVDGLASKRPGAREISLLRSPDPADLIPADEVHAVWYRDDELLAEAEGRLYRRQRCSTPGGEIPVGTATTAEILAALAALTVNTDDQIVEPGGWPVTDAGALSAAQSQAAGNNRRTTQVVVDAGARTWTVITSGSDLMITVDGSDALTVTGASLPLLLSNPSGIGYDVELWSVTSTNIVRVDRLGDPGGGAPPVAISGGTFAAAPIKGAALSATDSHPMIEITGDSVLSVAWVTTSDRVTRAQSDGGIKITDSNAPAVTGAAQVRLAMTADGASPSMMIAADDRRWGAAIWADASPDLALTDIVERDIGVTPAGTAEWFRGGHGVQLTVGAEYVTAHGGSRGASIEWPDDLVHAVIVDAESDPRYTIERSSRRVTIEATSPVVQTFTGVIAAAGSVVSAREETDRTISVFIADAASSDTVTRQTIGGDLETLIAPVIEAAGGIVDGIGATGTDTDDRVVVAQRNGPSETRILGRLGVGAVFQDVSAGITTPNQPRDTDPCMAPAVIDSDVTRVAYLRSDASIVVGTMVAAPFAPLADVSVVGQPELSSPSAGGLHVPNPSSSRVLYALQQGSTRHVYEIDPDARLFVRVFPPVISLSTGDWADAGAWHRGRIRELGGSAEIDDVRSVASGRVGGCRLDVLEIDGVGLLARTIGDVVEAEFVIDPLGSDAKIAAISPTELVVSWLTDESGTPEILAARWQPGQAALSPVTRVPNAQLFAASGPQSWDIHGCPEAGIVAWTWREDTVTVHILVEDEAGNVVDSTDTIPASTVDDVNTIHVGTRGAPASQIWTLHIGHSVLPTHRVYWRQAAWDPDALSIIDADDLATTVSRPAIEAGAVGPDATDADQIWSIVQVFDSPDRRVEVWAADAGGALNDITEYPRSMLHSQGTEVRGQMGAVVGPIGDPLLSNAQMMLITGLDDTPDYEVATRSWIGQSRHNTTHAAQTTPTSTIARIGDDYIWSTPGVSQVGGTLQTDAAITTVFDASRRPNRPVVVAGTATSAHGGYPREYDGEVHEQDWHALPEILNLIDLGGTSFPIGIYQFAVTWSWTSPLGLLYRSAPTIIADNNPTGHAYQIEFTRPVWSERDSENMRAEVWATGANSSEFRFVQSLAGVSRDDATDTAAIGVVVDPATLDTEILDTSTIGGSQGIITDFIAASGDRLWGRDPRVSSVSRHSLFDRAGLGEGRRWDPVQVIGFGGSPQEAVTCVVELDGRVVFGSENTWWRVDGSGPSDIGQGSYGPPVLIPSELGAISQDVTTRTTQGIVYGTRRGLYLLTRGLATGDIGSVVSRRYDIDNVVPASMAYDPRRGEVVIADGVQPTLVLATASQRWSRWPSRIIKDTARSLSGNMAYLTASGRVLEQVDTADPGVVTDSITTALDVVGSGIVDRDSTAVLWDASSSVDRLQGIILTTDGGARIPDLWSTGAYGANVYVGDHTSIRTDLGDPTADPSAGMTVIAGWRVVSVPALVGAGDPDLDVISRIGPDGNGWRVGMSTPDGLIYVIRLTISDGASTETLDLTTDLAVDDVASIVVTTTDLGGGTTRWTMTSPDESLTLDTALVVGTTAAPIRIGDTGQADGAADVETAFLLVSPSRIEGAAAIATDTLAALTDSTAAPTLSRRDDGTVPYGITIGTPWLRAGAELARGMRVDHLTILGEYRGPHSLVIEEYADLVDDTPVQTATITAAQIERVRLAGQPYLWQWHRAGDRQMHTARYVVRTEATAHEDTLIEGIDIELRATGTGAAELGVDHQVSDDLPT